MTQAHWSEGSGAQAADAHLDAILAGEALPLDADPAVVSLAGSLAALTETSAPEQDVPARVRDAYRDAFVTSNPSKQVGRKHARRRPMHRLLPSSLLSAKGAAVAVAAGGISLGGLTAAYAGVLPATAQNIAHHVIDAPAAKPHQPAGKPVGPDASGHAAYGLCTAWQHAHDSGKAVDAPAFRDLEAAAGGAGQVDGYCASVLAAKDGARGKGHAHTPPSPTPAPAPRGNKTHTTSPGKSSEAAGHVNHSTGKPTSKPPRPTKSQPHGNPGSPPKKGQGDQSQQGGPKPQSH